MSLGDECVSLYISKDSYDSIGDIEDIPIKDLVEACHSGTCPMGLFSCPIQYRYDCKCEDVTDKIWGSIFGIYEKDCNFQSWLEKIQDRNRECK